MKPETELSRRITHALERLGCVVVRVQSGVIPLRGRYVHCAEEGTPDRVVLFPNGVTRWLEIKHGAGVLSHAQEQWRDRARRLGHVVDTVWTFEEAMAVAREALKAKRSA